MTFKRILSFLLALMMLFSITACGMDQDTLDLALDVAEVLLEEDTEAEAPPQTQDDYEVMPEDIPDIPSDETPLPEEPAASPTDETPLPEEPAASPTDETPLPEEPAIDEAGIYTTKEDVALYLHTYGYLPSNFITKAEARDLGWPGGSLEPYAPGMCIGGDYFGNHEGLLPEKDGRRYTECDIDTLNADGRGGKRIVFSNDGLIYYTDDHYESFTLLYGDETT